MSTSNVLQISHSIQDVSSGSANKGGTLPVMPPPPPAPPKFKAQAAKKEEKLQEKAQEDDKEAKRVELFSKIVHYFDTPALAKHFPEHLKPPKSSDTYESLSALYKTMMGFLHRANKEAMVNNMFETFVKGGEAACVMFLKMEHMRTISDEILYGPPDDRDPQKKFYEIELAELAIELSDKWVPDAKTRLLFKVMHRAGEFLNRQGNPNATTSNI